MPDFLVVKLDDNGTVAVTAVSASNDKAVFGAIVGAFGAPGSRLVILSSPEAPVGGGIGSRVVPRRALNRL